MSRITGDHLCDLLFYAGDKNPTKKSKTPQETFTFESHVSCIRRATLCTSKTDKQSPREKYYSQPMWTIITDDLDLDLGSLLSLGGCNVEDIKLISCIM